jgi:hypothetical protein
MRSRPESLRSREKAQPADPDSAPPPAGFYPSSAFGFPRPCAGQPLPAFREWSTIRKAGARQKLQTWRPPPDVWPLRGCGVEKNWRRESQLRARLRTDSIPEKSAARQLPPPERMAAKHSTRRRATDLRIRRETLGPRRGRAPQQKRCLRRRRLFLPELLASRRESVARRIARRTACSLRCFDHTYSRDDPSWRRLFEGTLRATAGASTGGIVELRISFDLNAYLKFS